MPYHKQPLIFFTADITDVSQQDLETPFAWFRDTPKTTFILKVNQSVDGTDKANSIINLHLATGRIGKPGACPFSITGQPMQWVGGSGSGQPAGCAYGLLRR